MRAMLASLLLLVSSVCYAQGFGTSDRSALGSAAPQFLPVEEAYTLAVEIIDENNVLLHWQIEPGYYLYQHQFKFSLTDAEGAVGLNVELPQGLHHNDEYFGDVQIHYHSADVMLALERPVQQRATLSATSQGCADAGLCYPQGVVRARLQQRHGDTGRGAGRQAGDTGSRGR